LTITITDQYSLRDEQFTGRDLEILHLSEDDQAFPSTGFPNGTKRQRTAIEQENYDDLGQFAGDADGESDAHLEEPLRKKRRRSSRDIPRVKARNTALQKLAGQRISRANRKSTMNRSKSTKTYGTSQKPNKQKRRLPANELVTVTRRPGSSDIEVTSSEFYTLVCEIPTDKLSVLQADTQDYHRTPYLSR
jgi:hypothetical protein